MTFLKGRGLRIRHYLHSPSIKVFELKHVKIYRSHHCFLQEVLNSRITLFSDQKVKIAHK